MAAAIGLLCDPLTREDLLWLKPEKHKGLFTKPVMCIYRVYIYVATGARKTVLWWAPVCLLLTHVNLVDHTDICWIWARQQDSLNAGLFNWCKLK